MPEVIDVTSVCWEHLQPPRNLAYIHGTPGYWNLLDDMTGEILVHGRSSLAALMLDWRNHEVYDQPQPWNYSIGYQGGDAMVAVVYMIAPHSWAVMEVKSQKLIAVGPTDSDAILKFWTETEDSNNHWELLWLRDRETFSDVM